MTQDHNQNWETISASVMRTAVTRFLTNLTDIMVSQGRQIDANYIGRALKTAAVRTAVSAGLPPHTVLSENDLDAIEDWAAFNRELSTSIENIRANIEDGKSGLIPTEAVSRDNTRMSIRVLDAFMRANERDPVLTPQEVEAAIETALFMTTEQTNETIENMRILLSGDGGQNLSEKFRTTNLSAADIRDKIGIPHDDKGFERHLISTVLEAVKTQQFGARKSHLGKALAKVV